MNHPTPKTPLEMQRECLRTIANVCSDIERDAMAGNAAGVKVQFDFLKAQMNRLEVIEMSILHAPRYR